MRRGSRACGRLLVTVLLLPTLAWADPEVWLVIGPIVPPDAAVGATPSIDTFRPEAGAIALREGNVVAMPTCDEMLTLGLRLPEGASPRDQILVRLLKKRPASGCALEVLKIGTSPDGPDPSSLGTSGSSNQPSTADLRSIDARDVPCGSLLIVVRQGRAGGSSGSVTGLGRNGDCRESTDDMHSPIGISWLDAPSAGLPVR
jgi:hypothetical protein